jgi:hypothetical protein
MSQSPFRPSVTGKVGDISRRVAAIEALAPSGGVTTLSKSGDTPLTGDVTLTGGTGIDLTQVGQDIEITFRPIVDGSSVLLPHQAGYWYSGQFHNLSGSTTPSLGQAHAVPFWVPSDTTYDRIAVILLSTAGATRKTRLGIYEDDGTGFPGTLILDAGQISGDGSGAREKSITISQALAAGMYWLVGVNQDVAGNTSQAVQGLLLLNVTSTTLTEIVTPNVTAYQQNSVSAGLPDPWGGTRDVFISGAAAIRVYLRAA